MIGPYRSRCLLLGGTLDCGSSILVGSRTGGTRWCWREATGQPPLRVRRPAPPPERPWHWQGPLTFLLVYLLVRCLARLAA